MLYQIKKDVIYELFDNEVIMINLKNGSYYSIKDTAAEIWKKIEKSHTIDNIIESFISKYDADPKKIVESIRSYFDELVNDDLIETIALQEKTNISQEMRTSKTNEILEKRSFEPPLLERYTDMQDLLLLDPIHDVSDEGWPNPNVDNTHE